VVIAAGWDAYQVLIVSQVALSIQLPFAIGPLVWLTARKQVMGVHANSRSTTTLAVLVLGVLLVLNVLLLRGLLTN
jgi:manganese transport protein